MTRPITLLGKTVRDGRSGLVGQVIGIVTWLDRQTSLVVQPPVRDDRTVPPTSYVVASSAELVVPEDSPAFGQQHSAMGGPN